MKYPIPKLSATKLKSVLLWLFVLSLLAIVLDVIIGGRWPILALILLLNPITLAIVLLLLVVLIVIFRRQGRKEKPSPILRLVILTIVTIMLFCLSVGAIWIGSFFIFH